MPKSNTLTNPLPTAAAAQHPNSPFGFHSTQMTLVKGSCTTPLLWSARFWVGSSFLSEAFFFGGLFGCATGLLIEEFITGTLSGSNPCITLLAPLAEPPGLVRSYNSFGRCSCCHNFRRPAQSPLGVNARQTWFIAQRLPSSAPTSKYGWVLPTERQLG